jgi:hypothetical protein
MALKKYFIALSPGWLLHKNQALLLLTKLFW